MSCCVLCVVYWCVLCSAFCSVVLCACACGCLIVCVCLCLCVDAVAASSKRRGSADSDASDDSFFEESALPHSLRYGDPAVLVVSIAARAVGHLRQ